MSKPFKATLASVGEGDAWVGIQVPFDVERAFGSKGRVSVVATINGMTYHTSVFPSGDGTHHLLVNKTMQRETKAKVGDQVAVLLEQDDGKAPIELPTELARALKARPRTSTTFKTLTAAARREYATWVGTPKLAETRQARAEKAIDMIDAGKKRPSST